jgi:CRP-like cAMP-binding protein
MREELRQIRLFSPLDDGELATVEPFLKRRDAAAGERVIEEDVEEGKCYFLASGCMRVSSSMRRMDQEEVFSFLRAGDHFGEISLIDRQPPAASVFAEEPSRLYSISHEDLRRLMREHPGLASKILWSMLESFCRRLRETNQSLSFARFLMKRPDQAP